MPGASNAASHSASVGSRARPLGVRGRLVETDVRHGRVARERLQAAQAELAPAEPLAAVGRDPVERRLPAFALNDRPAVGQPELRARVAAVVDECRVFAVGHEPLRDLVRMQHRPVARPFVVEREAAPVVADLDDADRPRQPAHRAVRTPRVGRGRRIVAAVRGQQRIERERMQDVRQDQFLVLLLVMQAERDLRLDRDQRRQIGGAQQLEQRVVDVTPIAPHVILRRPRQHSALRPRMPRAERFVIRIEEIRIARIEQPVAARMPREDHGLEEPCRMREMPLRRTRVRHRLQRLVLRGQRPRELDAVAAHVREAAREFRRETARRFFVLRHVHRPDWMARPRAARRPRTHATKNRTRARHRDRNRGFAREHRLRGAPRGCDGWCGRQPIVIESTRSG
ncbi:hypothetical protein NCM_01976 [Burkholderia pseudomallei]